MSIKLSQLKQDEVKAVVKVGRNKIKIFNPTPEVKNKIIETMKEVKGEKTDIETEKIFTLLISSLTNIEIDVSDITDIMASPSKPMIEVIGHLNDIMQDIISEILLEQRMSLSMVEKTIMGKDISNKVEKINSMVKEIESNTDKMLK